MPDDNIIKLQNVTDVHIPEIANRSGTITLNYNVADRQTVEIDGSITVSEACYLHRRLGRYIDKLSDDED